MVIKPTVQSLQPVFFVGTPKSGTTFLLSLFDSHPSVVSLLETAAYHLPLRSVRDRAGLIARLTSFYSDLMGEHIINAALTPESVRKRLETIKAGTPWNQLPREVLYMFLSIIVDRMEPQSAQHLSHFIEKTPRQYDAVDAMFDNFPNAKVIHVLRDPRDNYLALKRMMDEPGYQGIGYHPTNFMRDRLLASLEAAYTNVAKYKERYRLVYYEDLILGGESIIRDIARWLELPWNDVLLVPSYNGELWKGNSLASDLKDRLKPFDRRPIGRWKQTLTEQEIDLLEWVIDAYSLSEKYPLTRHRTSAQRFWQLAQPFARELRVTGIPRRELWPQRIRQSLTWNYMSRRVWLAQRLIRRAKDADNRLMIGSFVSPQAAVSVSEA
jgi:hypothetical protein